MAGQVRYRSIHGLLAFHYRFNPLFGSRRGKQQTGWERAKTYKIQRTPLHATAPSAGNSNSSAVTPHPPDPAPSMPARSGPPIAASTVHRGGWAAGVTGLSSASKAAAGADTAGGHRAMGATNRGTAHGRPSSGCLASRWQATWLGGPAPADWPSTCSGRGCLPDRARRGASLPRDPGSPRTGPRARTATPAWEIAARGPLAAPSSPLLSLPPFLPSVSPSLLTLPPPCTTANPISSAL